MPLAPGQVLPQQNIQELQRALQECNEVEQIALKATDCGHDCRAHLAYCAALRDRISRTLHHFGGQRRDA